MEASFVELSRGCCLVVGRACSVTCLKQSIGCRPDGYIPRITVHDAAGGDVSIRGRGAHSYFDGLIIDGPWPMG